MNSDLLLMLLIAILASNQFIMRSTAWHRRIWIFWGCQLANVAIGSWLLVEGIPEFEEHFQIINILVGLLFLYHAAQNNNRFQKYLRTKKSTESIGESNV